MNATATATTATTHYIALAQGANSSLAVLDCDGQLQLLTDLPDDIDRLEVLLDPYTAGPCVIDHAAMPAGKTGARAKKALLPKALQLFPKVPITRIDQALALTTAARLRETAGIAGI
ncbi:MAG: hypothetical protein U1F10_00545 [Burkholderiales bacterium]